MRAGGRQGGAEAQGGSRKAGARGSAGAAAGAAGAAGAAAGTTHCPLCSRSVGHTRSVQVHENPRCIAFSVRHPVGPSCLPSLISRDCAFLGLVEDLMEKTRGSLFDAVPTAAAAAEDAERPRKRAKKKQEYVPGVGTANYAFLIILYQA